MSWFAFFLSPFNQIKGCAIALIHSVGVARKVAVSNSGTAQCIEPRGSYFFSSPPAGLWELGGREGVIPVLPGCLFSSTRAPPPSLAGLFRTQGHFSSAVAPVTPAGGGKNSFLFIVSPAGRNRLLSCSSLPANFLHGFILSLLLSLWAPGQIGYL